MDSNRLPKHALNYKPRGRRDRGCPRQRWQRVDAGTGQTTLSMEKDDFIALVKKVKQSRYRPRVAQWVPGS